MSVNKVFLVGRLGRDPELKYASSGVSITDFSIATTEKFKKGESWDERTEWHNIKVFGKQGENCSKYLSKGSLVFIEGKIQTSSWEDSDGNKKYKTEIIASNIRFLDTKNNDNSVFSKEKIEAAQNEKAKEEAGDDDLPF